MLELLAFTDGSRGSLFSLRAASQDVILVLRCGLVRCVGVSITCAGEGELPFFLATVFCCLHYNTACMHAQDPNPLFRYFFFIVSYFCLEVLDEPIGKEESIK